MPFFEKDYIKSNERYSRFERRIKDKSDRTRKRSVERIFKEISMEKKTKKKSERKITLQRKANLNRKINDNNPF